MLLSVSVYWYLLLFVLLGTNALNLWYSISRVLFLCIYLSSSKSLSPYAGEPLQSAAMETSDSLVDLHLGFYAFDNY